MTPLRLRCWEGYDSPALLDSFAAAQGTEVNAESLLSDAAAAARIAAGDLCDVLNINNAYVADYLHPRGLIEPLADTCADPAEAGAPLWQDPTPSQVSVPLQMSPSSHDVPEGSGVPAWQEPAPSQVSAPLQNTPSSHDVPEGSGVPD